MKILNLKLRGAIGIKKGLGKEGVEIDFTQFQPGLIALTGKNGSGKTTIMENLHPYRTMVSRSGSLQNHFYLKDSFRILTYEHDGDVYVSKILIDALTGGSEAYLICNGNPLNDGKLSTYDEELEKILGSQELFFNSVFSGQKSKGIAELKPADRRKLFYELLNLTVYEQYLEKAKSNLKAQEIKLAEIEGELRSTNISELPTKETLEKNRVEMLDQQAELTSFISDMEEDIDKTNEKLKDLGIKISSAKEKLNENDRIAEKLNSLENTIVEFTDEHNEKMEQYNSDIKKLEEQIAHYKSLVENKQNIEANINKRKMLEAQLKVLIDTKNKNQSEFSEYQKEYSTKLTEIAEQEKQLSSKRIVLNTLSDEAKHLNEKIKRTENEIETIKEVPCTEEIGSGCKFLINAFKGKEELKDKSKRLKELDELLSTKEAEIVKLNHKLETDKQMLKEKYQIVDTEITAKQRAQDEKIDKVQDHLDKLNTRDWDKLLDDVKEADSNIKILQEKISSVIKLKDQANKNYDAEIQRIKNESAELSNKLDADLQGKIDALLKKEEMENNHKLNVASTFKDKNNLLAENKDTVSKIDQHLELLKQNESKIEQLKTKKKLVEQEIKEWAFLQKAFDKTGIPVLKLENSGIEITSIANELLSLFENKFRIVFETTRLKADKKSYKESFDINIVEDDGVCEISNLSGGEQVYIETAIRLAISELVKMQGQNIKTAFLDEADGALSLDNAYHYAEMIRKSHANNKVHNTFIITHRTELLDVLPQKIVLEDGQLITVTN